MLSIRQLEPSERLRVQRKSVLQLATRTNVYWPKSHFNYSGSFPLGHLYSRDTPIQEIENMIPEKCSHNLWICHPYWKDTSIQGKGHFFWVPKPGFNLHSGDTYALKTWLTIELSHSELSHLNLWTLFVEILHTRSQCRFFIHYLGAWNNDWRRFRSRIFKKIILLAGNLLTNPCPTSIQEILASVPSTGLV